MNKSEQLMLEFLSKPYGQKGQLTCDRNNCEETVDWGYLAQLVKSHKVCSAFYLQHKDMLPACAHAQFAKYHFYAHQQFTSARDVKATHTRKSA